MISQLLKRFGLPFVVVLVLGVLVGGAGCSDDDDGGNEPVATEQASADGDAAAAEAAFQAAMDAWNAGDAEGYIAAFTDAGLLVDMGATREEAQQFLPDFIGDPQLSSGTPTTTVSGDTATVEALELAFGIILQPTTFTLVNQEGTWLIDNEEAIMAEIPEGTTAVDVALVEFAFDYEASEIVDGNIAFAASNIGGAEHELALLALDEGVDLEAALPLFAEGVPQGVEVLGQVGPWAPGEGGNVVFTEKLPAGSYALVCFVETADGTPHAFLGMTSEFELE